MYNLIKNVLLTGNYNLTNILNKINSVWLQNQLTDEEYAELISMARIWAKTENSINVLDKLTELEQRIVVLENKNNEVIDQKEYVEYEEGKWYYLGDKISFEGMNYTCIAPEGTVCVWSPKDYPTYWELV